ncbi:MAG: glycosyltransferase family 39 protein [Anaerolineae bacterium]|nr:glycosyltransferase family 39 protein [Anaerolineae bacterium]
MKLSRNQTWVILVGLLLFGYFVRVLHVGDQSIWGDEAFTYAVIRAENFWGTLARDVHPFLYFMMITQWTRFAGINELSLRYPSVLASTVDLALFYIFAKEALRHRSASKQWFVPLVAVLLLALADLDIQISQEARSYTLHIAWILLSFIAYLKWLRTDKRLWAVVFVISNALIVYTHYIGVFTPIAIGVHALLFLRGKQRIFAFAMLVSSALLVIPWVLLVLSQQVDKFAADAVAAFPSSWATLWALRSSWLTQQWAFMLGLAMLGLITMTPQNRLKIRPFRASSFLFIVLLIPLGLAFLSNLWLPTLYDYRISQITPAIVLLMAFGLANFQREARLFFLVVIVIYGVFSVDVYRPKEPWREFGQMVAEFAQDGDAVLLEFTGGDYTMDYYLERYLPTYIPTVSMWQWRTFEPQTYESGLLGTLDSYDSIWLARWSSDNEAFIKLRATNHSPTMRRTIEQGAVQFELYRFDRLSDESLVTFENGMILQQATIYAGQVDLWWSANHSIDANYTVSIKVFDSAGNIIAQIDRQPQLESRPTATWQADEIIYDPYLLETNGMSVTVQVYLWTPDGIQPVATVDSQGEFSIPESR